MVSTLLVGSSSFLRAQETGGSGELPPLEVENITVVGRRTLTLPAARKGEVYDSTIYRLPDGDTLLFGPRISNLEGAGGRLPEYQEFALPLHLDGEASMGTYISPRALVRAEYRRPDFDVAGIVDYRGTNGHIDSARAGSLLVGASGGLQIGDPELADASFRASGDFTYLSDSYFLYGNSATPYDRSRSTTRLVLGVRNLEEKPIGVDVKLDLAGTTVDDRLRDSLSEVTALVPTFSGDLSFGTDSLRVRTGLDYMATSLQYSVPTQTPAYFNVHGDLEWRPVEKFFLTGGVFYASGGNSDSGSTTMVMPRLSARYEVSPTISLFAWYAPELRPASYHDMLMRSPYVNREILLHPERVTMRLGGGIRLGTEPMTIEARVVVEKAENTPVVTASDTLGDLRYGYVASRKVGAEGSLRLALLPGMELNADAAIGAAVDDVTDKQLPMRPVVDLRGRLDYRLDSEIGLFASLLFQSERNVALVDAGIPQDRRTIPATIALGGGASYRFHPNVEAFAEVTNLLAYSYDLWQNYSAPGFELRGGVRVNL